MAFLEHKLNLGLHQKQILTPSLVQMVKLLALNKLELTDMIQQELVKNPVLEEDGEVVEGPDVSVESVELSLSRNGTEAAPAEPDESETSYLEISEREKTVAENVDAKPPETEADGDPYADMDFQSFENYLNDSASRPRENEIFEKPSFENFIAKTPTLTDHLEWQLGLTYVEEPIRLACHSLIGNLNEDGYLCAVDESGREVPVTLEEIAESGEHPLEDVQKALQVLQDFDPPGVAARDLRECLMLQLHALGEDDCYSMDIVRDHLDKVQGKQYKEIAKAMGLQLEQIMEAIEIVKALDPRPGQKYNLAAAPTIEPDVYIVKVGVEYKVISNEDELPQLRLSSTYRQLLERDALNKEVKNYVKDRFRDAVQLLKNLEQRKHIIVKVCESVIRRQTEFLDNGIDCLKPMMIKDVAEEIGVHPSTVSRAVANKYAHTAQGVFELRYFFSEAVNGPMGSDTSLLIVKRKVKKYIETEDPKAPLTDEKIAALLKERDGINVTRRSITKYREDMRIPSTHQRRKKD